MMDTAMSHIRTLLMAIALGFVGGFIAVSAANSAAPPHGHYSATG